MVVAKVRIQLAGCLYPNTPIEIENGGERIHLASEGEWAFKVYEKPCFNSRRSLDTEKMYRKLLIDTKRCVSDILACNAKFWCGEYPMLRPEWSGWELIDQEALKKLAKGHVKYDATLLEPS